MKVALLGFGTVGQGVYDILINEYKHIEIKYVLVKHREKHLDISNLLADSFEQIVNDPEIKLVIETIGGIDPAYHYVKAALNHQKHVVTANKALISEYFDELRGLAKEKGVKLRYEASVGAGIQIIEPLFQIARFNHIYKIEGIINGSTNYILSKIFLEDMSLDEALKDAKSLGYIEEDPKDDLEGFDLARKIHILSMIAYQKPIDPKIIKRIPLTTITEEDIRKAKANHQMIKYVARSKNIDDQLEIVVEPAFVDLSHLYRKINYEENIITLYGKYHLKQSFIGQGAGRYPTASAIINDILNIIKQS
ncbi:MAG: homoserine dehydrogenase [Acholeplasmataceae bacterium]